MGVDNILTLNPTQQIVVPPVNPASDEQKVISPESRLPVVGRKEEPVKMDNESDKQNMSRQDVEKLTQRMNQIMSLIEKRLRFNVSDESGLMDIQVKVIDEQTGKVLAVIPPKSLQDLMGNFRDAAGILFDEHV